MVPIGRLQQRRGAVETLFRVRQLHQGHKSFKSSSRFPGSERNRNEKEKTQKGLSLPKFLHGRKPGEAYIVVPHAHRGKRKMRKVVY